MKNILRLLAPLSFLLLLTMMACEPKEEEFSVTSPEGNITVNVQARKGNSLDPFMTDISAKGYDMKTAVQVEVYVKDMVLGNTVNFNWKSERECIITFQEQDGNKRKFNLLFAEDQVIFAEV